MRWGLALLMLLVSGSSWAAPATVGLQVQTTPPAASVRDITPLYLGLQRVWQADGMPYPVEAATSHTLRVSEDGYAPVDVDVPAGVSNVSLTLQPSTPAAMASFVVHYRRPQLLIGMAALLLAIAIPFGLYRRRLGQMTVQLMAAEMETRDLVGRVIDQYRLVEKVGEGAFADVYRVEHVQFHDEWALKLLKVELQDPDILTRFHREMTAGRDLHHPCMVRVHAYGHYLTQPYIVMEFLRGLTLSDLLEERGSLPPSEAIGIFMQVGEGLAFAHENEVVHRDLKPENIMLLPGGSVRIMDFGIAKFMRHDKLTTTGAFLGTPAYMSPEHLNSGYIDQRADIYSAGIILYEMLSGQTPFSGEEMLQVMFHQVSTPVPPLHTLADVPVELEMVVMRMLEKNPENRYQTVREALQAVEACHILRSGC